MAILQATQSGGDYRSYKLETLAPKGTFAATCVDCMESMGVERQKYQSDEMETVDLIRYLFLVDTKEGPFLVQTNEMRLSAYKEAALAKFIQGWTGDLPAPGFDTMNMVGEVCQLSINHKTSARGTTYPIITSISPLLDESMAPDANALEIPGGSRSGVVVKTADTETADSAAAKSEEDPF
jgi:hypothetical protein